ncbi:MAG: fimbrillin family protein [Tannerellaceae bacterium]|nr:fimbrillin family protein [Tannerellaceae bacterium]
MKPTYFLLIICLAFLFQGCGKDTEPPGSEPAGEVQELIRLCGSGVETVLEAGNTRAPGDFPNSQQIGVVAAQYNVPVDWTSYNDINNATAVTNREQGGTFYFDFSPVKYWPFDGSNLVFLAYSPPATATNGLTLEASRTVLDIQLTADTPDVMYASNNTTAATTPYSKNNNPTVNLGEFRHALSRLIINVIADSTMNPAVRLESLIVETTVTGASLNLLQGANGLTVDPPVTAPFQYTLTNSSTNFNNGYARNVIVMPGSEEETVLKVRFSDGPYFDYEATYPVTAIQNANNSGPNLVFTPGVNTTVNLTVRGTLVDHPEDAIYLQGELTDWDERDPLGVTIN